MQARRLHISRSVDPRILEGHTINLRDLMAVPMNPRQRIQVV